MHDSVTAATSSSARQFSEIVVKQWDAVSCIAAHLAGHFQTLDLRWQLWTIWVVSRQVNSIIGARLLACLGSALTSLAAAELQRIISGRGDPHRCVFGLAWQTRRNRVRSPSRHLSFNAERGDSNASTRSQFAQQVGACCPGGIRMSPPARTIKLPPATTRTNSHRLRASRSLVCRA